MFATVILRFGVMKTKQLAPHVGQNGNALILLRHASNIVNMQINAEE
jgi:hypothetical protein